MLWFFKKLSTLVTIEVSGFVVSALGSVVPEVEGVYVAVKTGPELRGERKGGDPDGVKESCRSIDEVEFHHLGFNVV